MLKTNLSYDATIPELIIDPPYCLIPEINVKFGFELKDPERLVISEKEIKLTFGEYIFYGAYQITKTLTSETGFTRKQLLDGFLKLWFEQYPDEEFPNNKAHFLFQFLPVNPTSRTEFCVITKPISELMNE